MVSEPPTLFDPPPCNHSGYRALKVPRTLLAPTLTAAAICSRCGEVKWIRLAPPTAEARRAA